MAMRRGFFLAQDCQEAARGRCVSVAGCGQFSEAPDDLRLSGAAPAGAGGAVRAGSEAGAGVRTGAAGDDCGGWHQAQSQRQQAHGDEPRAYAGGRGGAQGTNPIVRDGSLVALSRSCGMAHEPPMRHRCTGDVASVIAPAEYPLGYRLWRPPVISSMCGESATANFSGTIS